MLESPFTTEKGCALAQEARAMTEKILPPVGEKLIFREMARREEGRGKKASIQTGSEARYRCFSLACSLARLELL